VSQKSGLLDKYPAGQVTPIDGRGVYLESTPPAGDVVLAGQQLWKAQEDSVGELRDNGSLLACHPISNSYP
ncbi:hypothetical protein, partial [Stenotrophomonas maltophilia]|uniref:hypothetical protein n=1 Tax=Stenotrophomonas maltophilia TaxID=40324 RepID=UPI00313DB600